MAEDPLCKKGLHPMMGHNRKPKSSGSVQCRACHTVATRAYLATPKGDAAKRRASRRYDYSTAGMLRALQREIRVAGA